MLDKYQYPDDGRKKQLTAYERRKINTEKIASVRFKGYYEPSHPVTKDDKEKKWVKEKYKQINAEKKNVKPVWTPLDQIKEEELWDE